MNFAADQLRTALKKARCQVQVVEPLQTGVKALELLVKMGYTNSIHSTAVRMEDYVK